MSYRSFGRRFSRGRQQFHTAKPVRGGRKKEYINPSRFIKAAEPVEVTSYTPKHNFADFEVEEVIRTNIAARNFTQPSPIQDQAIPVGLNGQDIIGIANTGTGKTLAFAIPVLNQLLNFPDSRALIMAPTRELAQQIETEMRSIGKNTRLNGAILIGGAPMGPQLRDLRANPRIVIGTPGRIKDHIQRESLNITSFNIVVLDEVDRMLDMGFVHDMRFILEQMATPRQSFFFSATLDSRVNSLINTFANEPVTVSVKSGDTTSNVDQNVVRYQDPSDKIEKLHDLLINGGVSKAIVFDDTQRSVEKLSQALVERGFMADAIHGGKSQGQRQRALKRFKASEVNILVATDVAARGIDVVDITHVINYSTPQSYDDYVHRIGRAGRAGRAGYALTFIEH